MKILHIIASMNPVTGGPCQGIRNLNNALEAEGIHREVVSMDDPKASFLGSDPFIIHALGPGKSSWQYCSRLIPWLIGNLNRFDVAIVNGIWLYHAYATIKSLRILRRRTVEFQKNDSNKIPRLFIMPHGMLDPYFQRAPGRRLKALRNWVYWKLIESSNIQEANGVLFTCEEELNLARQTFKPYLPKEEHNIGYGVAEPPLNTIAMEKAFRQNCPGLENRPFLLFLSRIHQKKGIDLLIKAYNQVYHDKETTKERLKPPVLVIAGPDLDKPYGAKIVQLVSELGMRDFILFPGMLSGNAKWGAFYCCEVFVLPSHQENFGIAVAEALACSKGVLISNQVNIWREIENCKGGFVAGDSLQGTKNLLSSWESIKTYDREEMQKNARICFELHFAIEPAARRFVSIISPSYQFINN